MLVIALFDVSSLYSISPFVPSNCIAWTFAANTTSNTVTGTSSILDQEVLENDLWDTTTYKKELQVGRHLGAKMNHAFETCFKDKYHKVVLIGSDLYDLEASHIEEAFEKLEKKDVVIGPATDGGYYLIGLKKTYPEIFQNKNWGTSSVRKDTLKNLENLYAKKLISKELFQANVKELKAKLKLGGKI